MRTNVRETPIIRIGPPDAKSGLTRRYPDANATMPPRAEAPSAANSEDAPDIPKKDELLDSLTKGLALLRLYASGVEHLTMQEVAEQLDVTRAAARRLLLTLAHNGYLAQQGRKFTLTPKVMDLGYAYFASMNLPQLARPFLQALC
ncbi:helix-turn-helix domain-containing protein, partial [Segatella bryantii]|uniref:helix-turn-helix domain-containing protein n=1 Tax=Segatella bryantii TaxID=77095 RepID=UPI0028530A9D